ncbi:hypothetical protein KA111_02580 [Candidatus Woesebacteria bacterium]|nr:hypothetical protein [Candidatus Woesebacteria bacterium]
MIKTPTKRILIASFLVASMFIGGSYQKSQSASLSNVSATLSNSRLSFRGSLTTGNLAGSSQVLINTTTGAAPSTTSAQLITDDVVAIGDTNSLALYTITSVDSAGVFNVTPVLLAGDVDNNDDVISTQSATQTVRFTTTNAIPNGRFRILVPSESNDANAADGIPDAGQFDFGNSAPTVTCPADIANYNFVAGTATASAITVGAQEYHSYECAYSGNGAIGSPFNGTTNDAVVLNSIINPAPKSAHSTGAADTYRVIVQHLDSSFVVRDSTSVSIGVVESVRVTASVAPQITFQISGVASGATACGQTTDVTTTAAAVPLGELSISSFTDAAQALSVSTNAANGYVVTAVANDQLGRNGGTCVGDNTGGNCIPDSVGNTSTMTHAVADEWTTASVKGFGFSLDNINASGLTAPFEYDTVAGGCSGTYCARQFADNENSQAPQTIFSAATVSDNQNLYVCYRAIISNVQSAGQYENNINYTATATF